MFVSGNFINPSDKKFKKNIQPEKPVLDKLAELRPVTYTFKDTEKINLASGLQHGFVAQELEKVYPELIHNVNKPVIDKDGKITETLHFKSVNYLGLISILTQSVKDLSAEVKDLKQQVKEGKQTYVVYKNGFSNSEMENIKQHGYKLEQNVPNPFDAGSVISYSLPKTETNASIMIFNMTGRLLKTYKLNQKSGKIQVNADDFKNGIYLYSLVSGNRDIITKKMIIK